MSYTLRLKDSIDTRKAIRLLDNLVAKPMTYQVEGTNLVFNDADDLATAKSILSNKGIFNMIQKKSGRVFLTYTELQDLKQILMDKLYTVPNRVEIKDIYTYPELVDWLWRNAKKTNINNINNKDMEKKSIEIPESHLKEDNKEFDKIDKDAEDIAETVDELKKDDSEAMKKESINYWMKRQAEVAKDDRRIIKSSLNVTGAIEEVIIDEPLADAMGDITDDNIVPTESELTVEQPSADTINPEQSNSQILQQLKVYFLDNFRNDYTYENIVKSAQETGLLNALDTSDLFSLFNKLAIEVGLPRTDWSQFVSDDEGAEETIIADISKGKEGGVSYNEDNVDINGVMEGYDNAPENLFVIDRILEERFKLEPNSKLEPIVDEAKEIVKNSLKQIKKNCSVLQYTLNDIKIDSMNNSGIVTKGKVLWNVKLQFLKKGQKVHKFIEMTLPIKNGEPMASTEFRYVNANYPLQTYYLNNLIDK